ncbi:hypothetical protein BH20CHL6_BH20CHL6_17310 [soil metagenome]
MAAAARHLGVHPNTVRTWSDQGRLRCLRINSRGDRRYLHGDLEAFLSAAGTDARERSTARELRAQRRDLRQAGDAVQLSIRAADPSLSRASAGASLGISLAASHDAIPGQGAPGGGRRGRELHALAEISRLTADVEDLDATLLSVAELLRERFAYRMVVFAQLVGELVAPRVGAGVAIDRLPPVSREAGLVGAAIRERRPVFASAVAEDPRYVPDFPEVVAEIAVPIGVGSSVWGAVIVADVRAGQLSELDVELLETVANQVAVAVENQRLMADLQHQLGRADAIAANTARLYAQLAAWATQLQAIQRVGVRLSRLSSMQEIAGTVATELRQIIDYDSVRVYQVTGEDVLPVAWRSESEAYAAEAADDLLVRMGEGITGWVARHGVSQNLPDAAADPRAQTIPGTTDDDESMLLTPLLHEDEVLGVIVLSTMGLERFTPDDLRLLEIYGSFAAQALATVRATGQLREQSATLERQLRSQRDLLGITESILTTLDPHVVLSQICDRLQALVQVDNMGIDLHDREARRLRPLIARGVHADVYMGRSLADDAGLPGWVLAHGQGALVEDQRADPRVAHLADLGATRGSLIVVPLRGRDGVAGVLTLERLRESAPFTDEEFELVTLFAGQASIAMQNAKEHHAVEVRAQTDALTGLKNYGSLQEHLALSVERREPFSLLMLDLDHFKSYNDRCGHPAGDELLRSIAMGLVAASRDGDAVFRYGGDEFALLLPATDRVGAARVAARVHEAIAASRGLMAGGDAPPVTCSLGIAAFPIDGADREALLLAADRACYAAKRGGRARSAGALEGASPRFRPLQPTPVDPPTPA